VGVVCQSLQALVRAVQESGRAGDAEAVGTLAKKFLPTLFSLLQASAPDDPIGAQRIRSLSPTISAYASVAPKAVVGSLFKKLVQKLLEATQVSHTASHEPPPVCICVSGQPRPNISDCVVVQVVDGKSLKGDGSTAVVLCELAQAMVPSLDATSTGLLYKVLPNFLSRGAIITWGLLTHWWIGWVGFQVIRPLIQLDGDHGLQKRAYRVLASLCQHQADALLTQETLQDILPLLTDSLLTCHVSGTCCASAWSRP
jgi:hypothetical protein